MTPRHQPQLTGAPTAAVDCGVRATEMVIDWATHGVKVPGVKVLRERMGKPKGPTNPTDWQRAVASYDTPAELGGKYESIPSVALKGVPSANVEAALADHQAVILAVDYGVMRRLLPHKTGSRSFAGYHGILFTALARGTVTDWDSLLDGRYQGCPNGPVRASWAKVVKAAEAVGHNELGHAGVYALAVGRAVRVGEGVDLPEPDDDTVPTLASVLADLRDLLDETALVGPVIANLEAIIGPYTGPASERDDASDGVVP